MNAARLIVVGAMVCLIGALGRGDDKPNYAKAIVGKWEVTKADKGTVPLGTLLDFAKDGKLTIVGKKGDKDLTLNGTYKIDDDKLTFTVKVEEMERSQTITITKISDKEMSTKDKDDKVVELKKK